MLCKSQPGCTSFDKLNFFFLMSFLSPDDIHFKRKFSKNSIKLKSKFVLYSRFTPHTGPFFKFSTEL